MPNFDAGHYFLTALFPIDNTPLIRDNKTLSSPVRFVRRALSVLPKAQQSVPTIATGSKHGLNSPFTKSLRTHFARFVIIDDTIFNGRDPTNAIRVNLKPSKLDPRVAKTCDQLRCPYLLFVVDFDAQSGDASELDSYLRELWEVMQPELGSVFEHCFGFGRVRTAQEFAEFIKQGQIETTMPFNDYWEPAPDLPSLSPGLQRWLVAGAGITFLLAAVAILMLVIWSVASAITFLSGADVGGLSRWTARVWLVFAAALIAFAIALALLYRNVMRRGAAPFPSGLRSDLVSILKALYLQQHFQAFASKLQGEPPVVLHERFGEFLRQHRPSNVREPTQFPGVVRS